MGVITQLLEAIAVLIPDLQTLALIVPVFFSLYCCATSLGFSCTRDVDSALFISVILGYVVIVALNILSAMASLAEPRVVASSQLDSRVERWRVERRGAVKGNLARDTHI